MIEISNVCKTYETGNKALRNVSITIEDGEFVFIMGRSGSGKSTLMKLLLKEAEPTSGKIVVNDMNLVKMPRRYVPKYRRRLGVVFQDFRLLKDRNVYENLLRESLERLPGELRSLCRLCFRWWGFPPNIRCIHSSFPAANSSGLPLPGR